MSLKKKRLEYVIIPHIKENLFLEKKVSSVEGRFKLNVDKKKYNFYKNMGIYDDQYGLCLKIFVTYKYLKVNDVRITIDENISYKTFKTGFIKKDNDIIIELKTSFFKNLDDLIKEFPFQKIRFSKYCNGIETIN